MHIELACQPDLNRLMLERNRLILGWYLEWNSGSDSYPQNHDFG